jgi:hypothetical protein
MVKEQENFNSPSDALESYIQNFEQSNKNNIKKSNDKSRKIRPKMLQSIKLQAAAKPDTFTNFHRQVNEVKTIEQHKTSIIDSLDDLNKPLDKVEKLIQTLSKRLGEYNNEMKSININFNARSDRLDNFNTNHNSKSVMDSLQMLNENFSISSSSSSSSSIRSSKFMSGSSLNMKYWDEKEDPFLKCMENLLNLNEKLTNSTKNDEKCVKFTPLDTNSLLIPVSNLQCQNQDFNNIDKHTEVVQESNSSSSLFISSSNKSVQNFINECIKITNEIPLCVQKI